MKEFGDLAESSGYDVADSSQMIANALDGLQVSDAATACFAPGSSTEIYFN